MSDRQRVMEVADRIREHLARHPAASDSVDGIQRWWLAGGDATRAELLEALRLLLERGEVAVRMTAGGVEMYRSAGVGRF